MDQALQLLYDYNDHIARTAHHRKLAQTRRVAKRRASSENLAVMQHLAQWCQERGIEPRMWLFSLFASRYWTYAPPFDKLESEKHLAKFQSEYQGSKYFSNRLQSERNQRENQEQTNYDPNRDISGTVEGMKRHYLDSGNAQVCMDSVLTTLGFHPQSLVCARCPLSQACGQALQAMVPYDILALRRGEITAEHAQQVAALHAPRS